MPGYDTHYLFGIQAYRKIPNSKIRSVIKKAKDAYVLGMLGPDIFFFYATEVVAVRKNIGSIMHTKYTGEFLQRLLEYVSSLDEKKNTVELAYFCGFLTHYYLDSICHPFVYWRTDYLNKKADYLERHYQYESDMDLVLLRMKRNMTPYEFLQISQIRIHGTAVERVCRMLHFAIHKTYHNSRITRQGIRMAIYSIKKEQRLLKIFSRGMNHAIENIEDYFVGQSYLASLLPGSEVEHTEDPLNLRHEKWYNPWNTSKSSTASVPDMMDIAAERYSITIHMLEDYLYEFEKDETIYQMLVNTIGNMSYHSGLDSRIPS